ncbi:hypothetical protein J9303_13360 [Bacillaceae bacterium Marseille-Q3522]|nr:hypothetical protein [Bacillaceae bacterium Marseille-Q3522]
MKLLPFELKKIWRQKKILWLFIIVLLCTLAIFQRNAAEQSRIPERALAKIEPFITETSRIQQEFLTIQKERALDEMQENQLDLVQEMVSTLLQWRVAINDREWGTIPAYERDFLENLQQFEAYGGTFRALQGSEREIAIQKNTWLIEHDLPYEDEEYSLTPALLLKQSTESNLVF